MLRGFAAVSLSASPLFPLVASATARPRSYRPWLAAATRQPVLRAVTVGRYLDGSRSLS